MTTIHPFWYDGNGYHLFLINGWRITTARGASNYLTGLRCAAHIFDSYSELWFGDAFYSIYWPAGEFKKGSFDPYDVTNRNRSMEYKYGNSLVYGYYGVPPEYFKKCLSARLQLIKENKEKLIELHPQQRVGSIQI
jgi:hypothetical protein